LNRQLEKLDQAGSQQGRGTQENGQSGDRQAGQQPGGQQGGDGKSGSGKTGQSSQSEQPAQSGQSGEAGQSGQTGQSSQSAAGRSGGGQDGTPGSGDDVARLREDLNRQMTQVQELMQQLQRDDRTFARGGAGRTFEGQGMTLSAPGTEAFKQDFAKWQELRRQATQALDLAESTLSKKLQEKQAKDRLAAGVDDKAPPAYQQQVDSYFKALATRKKP
jgi:hypothetical protein